MTGDTISSLTSEVARLRRDNERLRWEHARERFLLVKAAGGEVKISHQDMEDYNPARAKLESFIDATQRVVIVRVMP